MCQKGRSREKEQLMLDRTAVERLYVHIHRASHAGTRSTVVPIGDMPLEAARARSNRGDALGRAARHSDRG